MKKGFTLIELLMVVALIAIVSTLAVTKVGGIREAAARKVSLANQKAVQRAVDAYLANGGRLNRLDSLIYAGNDGAPIFSSKEGDFDFSSGGTFTDASGSSVDEQYWLDLGPYEDDEDGKYREEYNAGITPGLQKILCPYGLSAAQAAALDTRIGLKYVMAATAYADAADNVYPQVHYSRTRAYGDGTYPNASNGLDPNDAFCVTTLITNRMTVAAINPMTDLGRTIYQSMGQELLNNDIYFGQSGGYSEDTVRAEVAATGGPLIAFGLGEAASIIGKTDGGLDSAPYATFAQKKYYSRYILLFRLKKAGAGSVSQILPEFAGVIDCCGNAVRGAQTIVKTL